jgi:Putative rhamnosyl transferase
VLFDSNTATILVTRYSVRSRRIMRMAKIHGEAMRIDWFRLRSKLFTAITLPSVSAQVLRPMRWYLLLADGDQPLLEEHVGTLPQWIKPMYLREGDTLTAGCHHDIVKDFGWAKNLLVSRMDNDDALHREFFKSMDEEVDWGEIRADCYLIQKRGCRWDGRRMQTFEYRNNPFLTVVSSNWKKTQPNPLRVNHMVVLRQKHRFLAGIPGEAMWLQSVHGYNASNSFREQFGAYADVGIDQVAEAYGVASDALDALALNTPVGMQSISGEAF